MRQTTEQIRNVVLGAMTISPVITQTLRDLLAHFTTGNARLRLFPATEISREEFEGLTVQRHHRVLSGKAVAAPERIKHAMIELGPTRDVVVDCCVYGEPARRYVEILRLGLRTLADHYGMP